MMVFVRITERVVDGKVRLGLSDEQFIHEAAVSGANLGATGGGEVDILLVPGATVEGGDEPADAPPAGLDLPQGRRAGLKFPPLIRLH